MQNAKHNTAAWPAHLSTLNSCEQAQLLKKIAPTIKQFLNNEKIPFSDDFLRALEKLYIPFAKWLTTQQQKTALVVGINGAQGSGKTSLTSILRIILEQCFNKKVVSFSIDDLYKTQQQRHQLAKTVHPLLATRGVPGTHDVELGISILKQLTEKTSAHCQIPHFDKASDNPLPPSQWTSVETDCDIILFEGWCVGAVAQDDIDLTQAINSLEEFDDVNGVWRHYVNQQLQTTYRKLFGFIDIQLLLQAPDFNSVYKWRSLQEKKLADNGQIHNSQIMNDAEIKRFIMHFERLTKHTRQEMPIRCDVVFELGNHHKMNQVITNR